MKKFLSSLCATSLALSFTVASFMPANAAPPFVPRVESAQHPVIQIQSRGGEVRAMQKLRREYRPRGEFRRDRREFRRAVRQDRREFQRRGDHHYWRGHRGYRHHHRGYREHNGFWFPAAAFIAGAIVSGALNNNQPVYRGGDAHVQWCYDRYRSYRAWDNTFQPYNGPRRQCRSPY